MAKENVRKTLKNAAATAVFTGTMGALVNRVTMPPVIKGSAPVTIRNNDGTVSQGNTETSEILNQAAINLHNSHQLRDVAIGVGAGLLGFGAAHALGRQWQKKNSK